MANIIWKTCSNCEGYGYEPNWFDLPEDPFKINYIIDNRAKTSKGRLYTEYKCSTCGGSGRVLSLKKDKNERINNVSD